jgi:hypothetical protein
MRKERPEKRRGLVVTFCCNQEEFEAIRASVRRTTCRSMSEYARKVLLGKPVTITNRNLSLDKLIDAVNGIRNELERLALLPDGKVSDQPELESLMGELRSMFYKISDVCIQNGM